MSTTEALIAEETSPTPPAPKHSAIEAIKTASRYLRGNLEAEFADPTTDHITEESKQIVKFHGSYQQEDRDARKNRAKAGTGKAYMFMLRLKLPGGRLAPDQYLTMDRICEQYGNSTLRFTTRQSIQLHGVLKHNMKPTIAAINKCLLTTLGGCGDINRNVMCCPAPYSDPARKQMRELSEAVAAHLAPRSGKQAYHEIWLNGEKQVIPESVEEAEPIYGKVYLPRKFKCGFSLPDDNCVDIRAQCLGFLCIKENGLPIGYNLYVGGGQGKSNSLESTYPLLAEPICFLLPEEVVGAAEAVCKFFRDHGNRVDRKRARLKYIIKDWGVEKFREVFFRDYLKTPGRPLKEVPITNLDLHLGWHPQGDGKWFLGISVENGRVKDEGQLRLRSGLRKIVETFQCPVRVTPQQDVLLCNIDPARKGEVDSLLNEYGIPRPENLSMVQKWSMACPATPTCGLAITESERSLPGVIDEMEKVLAELGLENEPISVRMTGCPNGCARPFQSEIGLVGRGGTKYTVYIGGDSFGRGLNEMLQDSVPIEQIAPKMKTIFASFKAERQGNELFGEYCKRVGMDKLKSLIA